MMAVMAPGRFGALAPSASVLVTGASGFIGTHLLARLSGLARLTPWRGRRDGDILDLAAFRRMARDADVILHVAGSRYADAATIVANNILGTANAAIVAAEQGIRLVLVSSAAAVSPVNVYGWSKLHSEAILRATAPSLPGAAILRVFNVFGEGDRQSVLARFLREPQITLERQGLAERDFVHVSDVADAIARAACPEGLVASDVGSGVTVPIRDLAQMVGKPIVEADHGGPQPMTSKAGPSTIPGWKPKIDVREWFASQVASGDRP